jgi:hypothetical protein
MCAHLRQLIIDFRFCKRYLNFQREREKGKAKESNMLSYILSQPTDLEGTFYQRQIRKNLFTIVRSAFHLIKLDCLRTILLR